MRYAFACDDKEKPIYSKRIKNAIENSAEKSLLYNFTKKMFSIPKVEHKKPNIRLGLFWDFPTAVTCFSLCMHHVCIVYSSLGITSGKDCKEKGNLDRFISVKLNVAGTASIFFSLASQKP